MQYWNYIFCSLKIFQQGIKKTQKLYFFKLIQKE